MTETPAGEINPLIPQIQDDEKTANVMVYTRAAIHWGMIIIKNPVRVSTWLRTNMAPEVLSIYNANSLLTAFAGAKPIPSRVLYLFTSEVLAFHLIPPQSEPLDFDPTEPNRYMDPVSILIGAFRIDGHMRLSLISNVEKYLDRTREEFTSIYDAKISNLINPSAGVMKVPYLIVRQSAVIYTKRP
jgi:hypothetical protein